MRCKAQLDGDALEKFAGPDDAGRKLLMHAAEAMRLSARGYTRMLRVARTIADLAGVEHIRRIHIAEASVIAANRREVRFSPQPLSARLRG